MYGGVLYGLFQPIKYLKSEQTTQISPKIYGHFMCECMESFCLNKNLLRLSNINYSNGGIVTFCHYFFSSSSASLVPVIKNLMNFISYTPPLCQSGSSVLNLNCINF